MVIRNSIILVGALALALMLGACSSDSTSSTSSAPDCSTGTTSETFSSDTPTWISGNFTCVDVTVSGDNIIIQTLDQPPYPSYYYPSGHTLNSTIEPTDTTNPNEISEQSYTFTIPASPAIASSTTATGLGEVGVAIDGTVIFNNEADAPDTLANEASTLDENTGHPAQNGNYHYHVEMAQIVTTGDELIGIALDGFPIYGRFEQGGSTAVFSGGASAEPSGGNWHDTHTPADFTTNTPHYHIVESFTEVGTSGSNKDQTVELRYMIGSEMAGTVGSVSQ